MNRLFFVCCCITLFLTSGCGKPNTFVEPPPPEVTVSNPVIRPVTEYLEFSGMTQPLETVELRARVKGFLKERHFVEGAVVRKDQLLLVIDEEPYQIRLESARAQLLEAEAALKQAQVSQSREVAQSQVNLSQAKIDLAKQEEQRIRSLFDRKVASESQMDEASAALKARVAELESARATLSQANATYETTILSCQAKVKTAEIAVRNAELDLSYCRMTAPIDGQISRINVDVGNLISDSGNAVLASIVRMDPMYAYATISEMDLAKVPSLRARIRSTPTESSVPAESITNGEKNEPSIKVPAELGLAAESGYPMTGHIDYTDPGLDPATGTLRVRGIFSNDKGSLLPGMFARMRLTVAQNENAMLVPERSLGTDQSGRYVLVVDAENRVQYRPVKTGVLLDGLRVVEGQLQTTDKVIVEGLLRARPGAKVVPVTTDSPEGQGIGDAPNADKAPPEVKEPAADKAADVEKTK